MSGARGDGAAGARGDGADALDGGTPALLRWWSAHVAPVDGALRAERLAGGASNLTYRIGDGARSWVLRRPPAAHVLATAHDMGREYAVQRALHGSRVPVARPIAECTDTGVIGAPFYVMEFVDGVVYRGPDDVAALPEEQLRAACFALVDALAGVHAIDPGEVGLAGFGRPEGFLRRQVERWNTQWDKSRHHPIPALDEAAARLRASVPETAREGIVHGDYGLNNVLYDRHDPARIRAVLDWEMATLGDPLTDVGMLSAYWGAAGRLLAAQRGTRPLQSLPGVPSADELAARYFAAAGGGRADLGFYQALATFKLSVITAGAYVRRLDSAPGDAPRTLALAEGLAELALDATAGIGAG